MPISALPSPYGIGTMGKAARQFIDFLQQAGQSWWQVLPVGPTSYADSPYQSPSTFAGNPYLIDLDMLVKDGLLKRSEIKAYSWGDDSEKVDYGLLYQNRIQLLRAAAQRGLKRDWEDVQRFQHENANWLADYALFMAVKSHFGMVSWLEWPDENIRLRKPEAVEEYNNLLKEDIDLYVYLQYLFFKQWQDMLDYAHSKGVRILGDLPIYVALDSADVWSSPANFQLDEKNIPVEVAGVPPDYFSKDGQLWGNPLYDYDYMKSTGYKWWIERIDGVSKLYDMIRIDHFRGFASYWAVPYGEKTARNGHWVSGPGMSLIGVLKNWFPQVSFVAEDLGYFTEDVEQLLRESGFPGMKILQFAFDSREESNHMPHTYKRQCLCYTGTHDNPPILGWIKEVKKADLACAVRYLGLNEKEGLAQGILRGGMSSVADLFIAQMQDWLQLGEAARMNTPGITEGNWRWRMLPKAASRQLAESIYKMTLMYGRCEKKIRRAKKNTGLADEAKLEKEEVSWQKSA